MSVCLDLRWQDHALCTGQPTEMFYPARGQDRLAEAALALCVRCPVQLACLVYALSVEHPTWEHGVWGGTNACQRRRLKRRRCDRCRARIEPAELAVQYLSGVKTFRCAACASRERQTLVRCLTCPWEGRAEDYIDHWRAAHPTPVP